MQCRRLALIAMAISFRWFKARRSHPNPLEDVKLGLLTANSGERALGSDIISPDGKRLAFSDLKGIHVQQIDTAISRPLNERYRDFRDSPYQTVVVLPRGRYRYSHDCGQHGCNQLLFAAVDGKRIRRANRQRPPCFLHLRSSHEDLARSGRKEVHF